MSTIPELFDFTAVPSADLKHAAACTPSTVLQADLIEDTGYCDTDHLTSNPTVAGSASSSDGEIVRLLASIDHGRSRFQDISELLAADGSFLIDRDTMSDLAGRKGLKDGDHTLYLRAIDARGHATETCLFFDLDTTAPRLGSIGLAADSDTGYRGDYRTETAIVDLVGRASPGSTVAFEGVTAIVGRDGRFVIEDALLDQGQHDYLVTVSDAAGNTTTSTLTLTRLENSVVHWNAIALDAIRATSTAPMYATRLLAMESTAMLEVVEAIEDRSFHLGWTRFDRAGANLEAAIAQAAYEILTGTYAADSGPYKGSTALRAGFDAALAAALDEIPDGRAEQRGIMLGHRIAADILAERARDGWNAVVDPAAEIGIDPGEWRPTPAGFANPLAPHWGDVAPWVIEAADQFLPPPPPALDSAEYATAYNETKAFGGTTSTARTADQTEIALFWADGAGTYTPPGHWNEIAGEVAEAEGRTTKEIALLFARLNVALADAAITCWQAKYTFDYWRPVTAIRLGDTDGNDATIADATWTPLISTPPFPEYTSGHSTFSGAAATILTAEFGADYAFTTGTPSTDPAIAGVTRSFTSFWAAALEAGQSRIYGGIHFQPANREGLACGEQIGNWVLANFGV